MRNQPFNLNVNCAQFELMPLICFCNFYVSAENWVCSNASTSYYQCYFASCHLHLTACIVSDNTVPNTQFVSRFACVVDSRCGGDTEFSCVSKRVYAIIGYIIVVKCDKLIGENLVMIPAASVQVLSYIVLSV